MGIFGCVEKEVAEPEGAGYANGGCGGKCRPSALPGGVSSSAADTDAEALAEADADSLGAYCC
jgi:hypothetical protein